MLDAKTFPKCIVLVSDKPANSFPTVFYLNGWGKYLHPWIGRDVTYLLVDYKNGEMLFCVEPKEWGDLGKIALKKVSESSTFFDQVYEGVLQACNELVDAATAAQNADYAVASNAELLKHYRAFEKGMHHVTSSGLVFTLIEARNEFLTKQLKDLLEQKVSPEGASSLFSLLTTPTKESYIKKETRSLLEFGIHAVRELGDITQLSSTGLLKKINAHSQLKKELDTHYKNYFWISYIYEGPAFSKEEMLKNLIEHTQKKESLEEQLHTLQSKEILIESKQKKAENKLQLIEKEKYLFACARGMVFLKGYRKDMAVKAYCFMEKWLIETGKKMGLTIQELRMLTPNETEKVLLNGIIPDDLKDRKKHYTIVYQEGKTEVFSGANAKAFEAKIIKEEISTDQKVVSGTIACVGVAKGYVKIINTVKELKKMEKGDILVSLQTNPNLMPAISKAGAIIAESGGITSHAAIVSREMQIPCIINVKGVTKWLKDGDFVEVDATHGLVRMVKKVD